MKSANTNTMWFATQVDRDFETNHYGNGTRLYMDPFDNKYQLITGYSFDGTILKVQDTDGNIIELKSEPENTKFENTLYKKWKDWDTQYGSSYEEDRPDYEPWAYNSLVSLAIELGLHETSNEVSVQMFYKKTGF